MKHDSVFDRASSSQGVPPGVVPHPHPFISVPYQNLKDLIFKILHVDLI